jgi:serine/threonine-protein kinase
VKLVDFGVAKAADSTTVTGSGVFKGKIRYASPEQVLCTPVTRRADLFAMGVLLWEAIANRRMWRDMSDASIMLALASSKIPDLRDQCPDAAPELVAICNKALAIDPALRYATANEMRTALLDWLKTTGDNTDLGTVLRGCFQKERSELRLVIDTQIKTVREMSTRALTMRNIPVFQVDPMPMGDGTVGAISPPSRRPFTTRPPRTQTSMPIIIAVVAVGVLIGGAVLFGRSGKDSEASSNTSARPVPAEPTSVHLSLRASPATARLMLDGKPLASNPYEGDVSRDEDRHRLSVAADGFEPRDLETSFAHDVHVDVSLSPRAPDASNTPKQAAATRPAAPRAVYNPPPQQPAEVKPSKPNRGIDEEDPYR